MVKVETRLTWISLPLAFEAFCRSWWEGLPALLELEYEGGQSWCPCEGADPLPPPSQNLSSGGSAPTLIPS